MDSGVFDGGTIVFLVGAVVCNGNAIDCFGSLPSVGCATLKGFSSFPREKHFGLGYAVRGIEIDDR